MERSKIRAWLLLQFVGDSAASERFPRSDTATVIMKVCVLIETLFPASTPISAATSATKEGSPMILGEQRANGKLSRAGSPVRGYGSLISVNAVFDQLLGRRQSESYFVCQLGLSAKFATSAHCATIISAGISAGLLGESCEAVPPGTQIFSGYLSPRIAH